MRIERLELRNFRNYESAQLGFEAPLYLILGENGQGKTNLIEAISLLSTGRSFRTGRDKEMIRFGEEALILRSKVESGGRSFKIEIKIGKQLKKAININSLPIGKLTDLLGIFHVVVFAPEDLRLVKDGPKERRGFMDREISQLRPLYYSDISSFRKLLMQRNNLLRGVKIDRALLDVYDEQLAFLSERIMGIRAEFIEKIAPIAAKNHRRISGRREELLLRYEPDLGRRAEPPCRQEILELYRSLQEEDIRKKMTGRGIHKDDLRLEINGRDIRAYGSQGQKRSAAISLKLSEIELVHEERGEYPVVLLDDIFSELDTGRQRMLIENLKNVQTFVTATDIDDEILPFFEEARMIWIENAKVKELPGGQDGNK